jgi:hypothetical protein
MGSEVRRLAMIVMPATSAAVADSKAPTRVQPKIRGHLSFMRAANASEDPLDARRQQPDDEHDADYHTEQDSSHECLHA